MDTAQTLMPQGSVPVRLPEEQDIGTKTEQMAGAEARAALNLSRTERCGKDCIWGAPGQVPQTQVTDAEERRAECPRLGCGVKKTDSWAAHEVVKGDTKSLGPVDSQIQEELGGWGGRVGMGGCSSQG